MSCQNERIGHLPIQTSRATLSKVQHRLVAHVEEQVEDGKVGQETVFPLVNLVISPWRKVIVGQRTLGTDGLAEVEAIWLGLVMGCQGYGRLDIKQLA